MTEQPQMPGPGDLVAERFRIEKPLSRGGMGAVFVARHVETNRAFALKLMSSHLAGDTEAEARFVREARIASSLQHPAIVEVYDVGRHEGFPYMVMQLLQGESLGARIGRGRIPPGEALALIAPALEGIAAAHATGVVHRDLKPDNIYLAAEHGQVHTKVLDFGISKLVGVDVSQKLTATGVALGTPLYMSPEQVRGARDIDARTDVYSLGVILYEMLTGVPPYRGDSFANLVYRIVTGDAPAMRSIEPSLSPQLEQVVARAMAVASSDRHPDVLALLDDLRSVVGGAAPAVRPRVSQASDDAAPTPFAASSLPPPPTRHDASWMWLALAALAVVGAAAFAWSRMGAPEVTRDQAPVPAAASPAAVRPAPPVAPAPEPPPAVVPTAPLEAMPKGAMPPKAPSEAESAAPEPASPPKSPPARSVPRSTSTPTRAVPAASEAPAVAAPAARPPAPEPRMRVLDDQPRNPFE